MGASNSVERQWNERGYVESENGRRGNAKLGPGNAEEKVSTERFNIDQATFKEFLTHINPSGDLLCYEEALADNLDNAQQILPAYTRVDVHGEFLHESFFQDTEITDPQHIRLFNRFFTQECGLRECS